MKSRLIQMRKGGSWQEKKRLLLNISQIPLRGIRLYWRREIWCEERLRKKKWRLSVGFWLQRVSSWIQTVTRHCSKHCSMYYIWFNTLTSPSPNLSFNFHTKNSIHILSFLTLKWMRNQLYKNHIVSWCWTLKFHFSEVSYNGNLTSESGLYYFT